MADSSHDDDLKKLDYATPASVPTMVRLANYSSEYEAELAANALNAEGITTQIFGANTNAVNWFWVGFNSVELMVLAADVPRAREILSKASAENLEPVPELPDAGLPVDEQGNPLVIVGAYETVQQMRDAQAVLESSSIRTFAPRLEPRGDRPLGTGTRFVLRVAEVDLPRAQKLIEDEADEDAGEARCPKCGSWRVYQSDSLMNSLAALVGRGRGPQAECLSCHYKAPAAEFLQR
jgi:Putative prokaryotic signal transducing protein